MRNRPLAALATTVTILSLAVACSRTAEIPLSPLADGGPISVLDSEDASNAQIVRRSRQEWKGDFEGMKKRRYIRALVTPNRTQYFLDGAEQRGSAYELLKQLEDEINQQLGSRTVRFHVLIMPTTRDRLLPDLVEGRGDLAATNLTITPDRQELVDFTTPFGAVDEIIVTGPGAPPLTSLEDLAGKKIYIRESSSFWQSLETLNLRFADQGLKRIRLEPVDERLETEDILELVNTGVIEITVADSYLAEFWSQIYDQLTLHPDLAVRTGGQIAWAFRKNSPQLEKVLNGFMKDRKLGTLMGNVLFKRYYEDAERLRNPSNEEEMERFREAVQFFRKYGQEYDLDYLLIAAQAYQESRIDQSLRSKSGAIGIMQLLKSTASDPNVGIPDIEDAENNIHAGVKYLRFLADRYFDDDAIDPANQKLLALAAYNAGPARIAGLRQEAAANGLDPNRWFNNVEIIASRRIGRETVQYVSNIYKYLLAYTLIVEQEQSKAKVDI